MSLIFAVLEWLAWLPAMRRVFGGLARGDISLRAIAENERGRDFDTRPDQTNRTPRT